MSESPWRVALALILIGSMAGGALWLLLSDRQDGTGLGSLPPGIVSSTAAVDAADVGDTTTVVVAIPPAQTSVELAASDESDILLAATNALTAWGEFAVTGDLLPLEPYFAADGRQMEQFRDEAPGVSADPAGPPPYDFLLSDPSIVATADTAVVSGLVVMSRDGEADQRFEWDIHLVLSGDGWLVWTVSEQAG